MKKVIIFLVFIFLTISSGISQNYAFDMNARLGNGINLGNAYEATALGSWGVNVDSSYFIDIKQHGFTSIRIPARWSAHALKVAPYSISEYFMDTIQWAVNQCLANGLSVVLDIHHYDEMFIDPAPEKERMISFWNQISTRFEGYSDSLYFEVFNEPHDNFTPEIWNQYLVEGINTIRQKHPTRMVIIGTAEYGGIGGLSKLVIPADTCLIVTIHYYNPFPFTHQGATFVGGNYPLGVTWDSTAAQINAVKSDMNIIKAYSEAKNVPIYIGEFGAIQNASDSSRAKWAGHLRKIFEEYGFSSAYWEFSSGFGIYNSALDCYYTALLQVLTDSTDECDCSLFDTVIIKNSSFDKNIGLWIYYNQGGAEGNLQRINNEARVEIIENGTAQWHLQLSYSSFPVVLGSTYKLTFEAYASSPTDIKAILGKQGGDWLSFIEETVNLTTSKQTFTFYYTMENPTILSRISFDCGLAEAQYIYFDNVHVYEIEEGVPVESITITDETMSYPTIIDSYQGTLQLQADVLPLLASNTDVVWSIVSGSSFATISNTGIVQATGTGNGTILVKAVAFDGSGVSAQKTIYIRNQNTDIADVSKKSSVTINNSRFEFDDNYIEFIEIYDVLGKKCKNFKINNATNVVLPNDYFPHNMYFIKVKTNRLTSTVKYFKK